MRKSGKKSLVIGASGFIGRRFVDHLASQGEKVIATLYKQTKLKGMPREVSFVKCDVTSRGDLKKLIQKYRPDFIYYLAAQSSVRQAWFDPVGTVQVNLMGGLYLLEVCRELGLRSRNVFFSSGTTYGSAHLAGKPLKEDVGMLPKDPYGVSKMGLEFFAKLYAKVYRMDNVSVRLANIVGPGQSTTFSLSNFAYQIAGINKGKLRPTMEVGNILAKRDYLDVRDAVRAVYLLSRKGKPGEAYNVGSGISRDLKGVLERFISISGLKKDQIRIIKKKALMSKDEIPAIRLNVGKIRGFGWRPRISFEQTLTDILNDWGKYWNEA